MIDLTGKKSGLKSCLTTQVYGPQMLQVNNFWLKKKIENLNNYNPLNQGPKSKCLPKDVYLAAINQKTKTKLQVVIYFLKLFYFSTIIFIITDSKTFINQNRSKHQILLLKNRLKTYNGDINLPKLSLPKWPLLNL